MNHYDTLGVARDASAAEIKTAYRSKSREHHPDKEGGSTEAMQAVNQAYEVLGDPERRALYDATGKDKLGLSVDDEALGLITRFFADGMELKSPVLAFVHCALDNLQAETTSVQAEVAKRSARLARRRATVIRKTGDNLFHELVDKQIAELASRASACATLLAVVAAARRLLNDYEAVPEEPVAPAGWPQAQTFWTALPQGFA